MHFDYSDVDIRKCNGWFTNCWAWHPDMKRAVLINSILDARNVLVVDNVGRRHRLNFHELDVYVPELGYLAHKAAGKGLPIIGYYFNKGERNYSRGLALERVLQRYEIVEAKSSIHSRGRYIEQINIVVGRPRIPLDSAWIDSAFNPMYSTLDDIVMPSKDGSSSGVILSKDFAAIILTSKKYDSRASATLCYKGIPVAQCNRTTIFLPEKYSFLEQKIAEDLPYVQITRIPNETYSGPQQDDISF